MGFLRVWQDVYRNKEEIEADVETQKAKNRKILLEMIGDRPDAESKPPEEFLFVCKLNPITNEEDLETIFSRFGEIVESFIKRDPKTGGSMNYGFIGFSEKKCAEEAYLKMNNALIDDRSAPPPGPGHVHTVGCKSYCDQYRCSVSFAHMSVLCCLLGDMGTGLLFSTLR